MVPDYYCSSTTCHVTTGEDRTSTYAAHTYHNGCCYEVKSYTSYSVCSYENPPAIVIPERDYDLLNNEVIAIEFAFKYIEIISQLIVFAIFRIRPPPIRKG